MSRFAILVAALLCLPAAAFDIHKWADDLANRQMERWKREQIETALKGRNADDRLKAVEGLSYADADACATFAIALSDSDARVRKAAASQLWSAEKRAEPYREPLMKALDDPEANVVAYAAGALQAIGMKEAELAPARKRVLAAPETTVIARFLVARNLVGYEPPMNLLPPMLAYLEYNTRNGHDKNRENVDMVQRALERLAKNTRERKLIQPLWEALVETRHGHIVLMKALAAFEPRPEGWTHTLLRQLDNPNPRVRYAALGHLRDVKDEKEITAWLPRAAAMLQDPDPSVRSEALWAVGSTRGLAAPEVDKVVAALASDAHPGVRRSAARALGEMAQANQAIPAATRARLDAAARPALDAALQDVDKDVRDEAKSALGNVNRRGAAVAVAAAAPGAATNEAAGMAVLRARNVTFEENSFFRALSDLDVELIRAFLDAGMAPNGSLSDMGPPMRVMLFSSQGCAPNVRPTKAETKAAIRLLLDRGADVNASDKHGNNAVTEAASRGCDRETIRMLIKAGARIGPGNHASGLAPFEMGLYSGHDGLEEFLAAGYRLPPEKVKLYLEGYKDRPAAIQMVKKAAAKK